jgi:hypothetical protein
VDLVGVGARRTCSSPPAASARRGEVAGLVTRVCPADELGALLQEYTEALARERAADRARGKRIMQEILKPTPTSTATCASG